MHNLQFATAAAGLSRTRKKFELPPNYRDPTAQCGAAWLDPFLPAWLGAPEGSGRRSLCQQTTSLSGGNAVPTQRTMTRPAGQMVRRQISALEIVRSSRTWVVNCSIFRCFFFWPRPPQIPPDMSSVPLFCPFPRRLRSPPIFRTTRKVHCTNDCGGNLLSPRATRMQADIVTAQPTQPPASNSSSSENLKSDDRGPRAKSAGDGSLAQPGPGCSPSRGMDGSDRRETRRRPLPAPPPVTRLSGAGDLPLRWVLQLCDTLQTPPS